MYNFNITSSLCMKNKIVQMSSHSLSIGFNVIEKISNNRFTALSGEVRNDTSNFFF